MYLAFALVSFRPSIYSELNGSRRTLCPSEVERPKEGAGVRPVILISISGVRTSCLLFGVCGCDRSVAGFSHPPSIPPFVECFYRLFFLYKI